MSDIKQIIDLCDYAGIEWRPYNGRGMYGQPACLGIVTDNAIGTVLDLVSEALSSGAPEYEPNDPSLSDDDNAINDLHADRDYVQSLIEALQGAKTDSMGLSTIVYWPRLVVTDDCLDGDSEGDE